MTATLMEGGNGWKNIKTVSTNIPADVLYMTPIKNIVDAGSLARLAMPAACAALFKTNNFTRLWNPFLVADDTGYNSGNYLNGLSSNKTALYWNDLCIS